MDFRLAGVLGAPSGPSAKSDSTRKLAMRSCMRQLPCCDMLLGPCMPTACNGQAASLLPAAHSQVGLFEIFGLIARCILAASWRNTCSGVGQYRHSSFMATGGKDMQCVHEIAKLKPKAFPVSRAVVLGKELQAARLCFSHRLGQTHTACFNAFRIPLAS